MLRIASQTKLSPEEATKRAIKFFNGDYGLKITEQSPTSACFEGAGGGVEMTACPKGKGTEVELVSRQWFNSSR